MHKIFRKEIRTFSLAWQIRSGLFYFKKLYEGIKATFCIADKFSDFLYFNYCFFFFTHELGYVRKIGKRDNCVVQ